MTWGVERQKLVLRRQERKRRLRSWVACVGGGSIAGLIAVLALGGWVGAGLGLGLILAGLAIGHRFMLAPAGVPILTYHSVSPDASWLPWGGEISVHPETLRQHLAAIRSAGREIVLTGRLVEARSAGKPLPARPVVLHFDDGYLDNWLHAAPILREAKAPATFFASLDFIAPGEEPRRWDESDDRGYMNWAELAQLDSDPLFEVEPHGVDHGRVPISDRTVDRLTKANWRTLAWVQWAHMPGAKHDWYLHDMPPAVPLGSQVPESEGALAAPAWRDGRRESGADYRARVADHLGRCRTEFSGRLLRRPAIFCWPENRVSAAAREIAASLDYAATTGGEGRNTAAESPFILSRVHAGDRALGFRFGPAERLNIRAIIGLFEGNHYWYLVTAPMNLIRRVVLAIRRLGHPLYQVVLAKRTVSLRYTAIQ